MPYIAGRNSQVGVEVCRLLERTIRDSRAVDLESLCIVTGEKVRVRKKPSLNFF